MIELRPYRAYLFDIDGTLLSCGGLASQAVYQTMTEDFGVAQLAPSPSFCGRTDRGILAELFGLQGIADTEAHNDQFYRGYTSRLRALLPAGAKEPLPGVLPALHSLQSLAGDDRLVTIMTGNCKLGAVIKLEGYGIAHFFELEQGGYGDDHPLRNDLAAATYAKLTSVKLTSAKLTSAELSRGAVKLNPDEILVIGDTVADIDCARHIGADCLAVATGNIGAEELKGANPRYLVTDLTDVRWT